MKFQVEVVCLDGARQDQRHTVLTIKRPKLAMGSLGMSMAEGLPRVRSAIYEQGCRDDSGEDRLRLSAGGESTLDLLPLSERRSAKVTSPEMMYLERNGAR